MIVFALWYKVCYCSRTLSVYSLFEGVLYTDQWFLGVFISCSVNQLLLLTYGCFVSGSGPIRGFLCWLGKQNLLVMFRGMNIKS